MSRENNAIEKKHKLQFVYCILHTSQKTIKVRKYIHITILYPHSRATLPLPTNQPTTVLT